jgi:predicted transcriptional regulator
MWLLCDHAGTPNGDEEFLRPISWRKLKTMEMLPVKPDRKAQLDTYAQRHGQDTAEALDEVLANYLEWEQEEHAETVEAVMEAYADIETGNYQPAEEFLEELRMKHGLSR